MNNTLEVRRKNYAELEERRRQMIEEVSDREFMKNIETYPGMKDLNLTAFPREALVLKSTDLLSLDISGNLLTKIPFKFGKNLPNLTFLDAGDNALTQFPKEILELRGLEYLRLHKNKIKVIPTGIKKLTNLKEFNVHANVIEKLPAELFILNLEELNAANNPLTALPPNFESGLQSMLRLALYGCKLDTNLDLTAATMLQQCEFSRNRMTEFPICSGVNQELIEIEIATNLICDLPDFLGDLNKLQGLSVVDNKLKTINPAIGRLDRLQRLRLADNLITTLPIELFDCVRLVELDLSNNYITAIPPQIEKLRKLKKLFMAGNKVETLPLSLSKLKLERVLMAKNPLKSDHRETRQVIANFREKCESFDWVKEGLSKPLAVGDEQMRLVTTATGKSYVQVEGSGEILNPLSVRTFAFNAAHHVDKLVNPDEETLQVRNSEPAESKTGGKRRSVDWRTQKKN